MKRIPPPPIQFFIAHIMFDEKQGPVLKSYLAHELDIPRIILQGVTTTLFTMAIGVGEPTGEPETAIIPINVTGIQGRVLIHSFSIKDPSVRGSHRIESFMLFIPRAHQDKLLQHTFTFSNILTEAVKDFSAQQDDYTRSIHLEKAFNDIKAVILTRIDNRIQKRISEACTEDETVIVSDGTIRAFHNVVLTPRIISLVNRINSLILDWGDDLKTSGIFFDTIPIEIYGKTAGDQQCYLIAIEHNFLLVFSSGPGRLGSLFRIFREVLWDINIQGSITPAPLIPRFRITVQDRSNLFPNSAYLKSSYDLLTNFRPILTEQSIIRCSCEKRVVDLLRSTNLELVKMRHALVTQIFTIIQRITENIFKTSLAHLVLSQHVLNVIAILWGQNTKRDTMLFLVGDSTRGVGLLKLTNEQILDYRQESIFL